MFKESNEGENTGVTLPIRNLGLRKLSKNSSIKYPVLQPDAIRFNKSHLILLPCSGTRIRALYAPGS
jgi:hypothetical protein